MPRKAKEITAWSYSRLADYEQCPLKYEARNILKLDEPKGDAMFRGITIHNEAAKFLAGETEKFPLSCAAFRDEFYELRDHHPIVEQKWAFTNRWKPTGYFAKNTYLRATLDAAVVYTDRTADVIDHKTGKLWIDRKTNVLDLGPYEDQMGLFAAATIIMHPELTHVTSRLWYLDADEEVILEFPKAKAFDILNDLNERAQIMMNAKRFPPRPNPFCNWCHFRKSNGGHCKFG